MNVKTVTCTGCLRGIKMCERNPCMSTPAESRAIAAAGYAGRLMTREWLDHKTRITMPAYKGSEGQSVSYGAVVAIKDTPCTFLTADKRCELHDQGLKPAEGRAACCMLPNSGTDERRRIVKLWKREAKLKP